MPTGREAWYKLQVLGAKLFYELAVVCMAVAMYACLFGNCFEAMEIMSLLV